MDIKRETATYNQRRYGRPWIAKIVIKDGKLDYQWGQWVGDHYNGSEGLLILTGMAIGDIFAKGQRDNRKIANSAPDYYQLDASGKGISITKAEAYIILTAPAAAVAPEAGDMAGIGIGIGA